MLRAYIVERESGKYFMSGDALAAAFVNALVLARPFDDQLAARVVAEGLAVACDVVVMSTEGAPR